MCGIVAIINKDKKGKIKHQIKHLIGLAKKNKHRGEDDGFGVIDLSNKKIYKTILNLDEIRNQEISLARKNRNPPISKKVLKSMRKWNEEVLQTETDFAILHHRKASIGEVRMDNTHPFEIAPGIHYIHNGSVVGTQVYRNYIATMAKIRFKSSTDSEVIAYSTEGYLKNDKLDDKKRLDLLSKIFGYFGVIIRIDSDKEEMKIMMDDARTLFLYEHSSFYLLISEPVPEIYNFKRIYELSKGVYTIGRKGPFITDGTMYDVTQYAKDYIRHKSSISNVPASCDLCKERKTNKRFHINLEEDKVFDRISIFKDVCMTCYISFEFDQHVYDELKKQMKDNVSKGLSEKQREEIISSKEEEIMKSF